MAGDNDKLAIALVQGLIDEAVKKVEKKYDEMFATIQKLVNDNSTSIEERFKKVEKAIGTLDSDLKAGLEKKPFSLGFLDFE